MRVSTTLSTHIHYSFTRCCKSNLNYNCVCSEVCTLHPNCGPKKIRLSSTTQRESILNHVLDLHKRGQAKQAQRKATNHSDIFRRYITH